MSKKYESIPIGMMNKVIDMQKERMRSMCSNQNDERLWNDDFDNNNDCERNMNYLEREILKSKIKNHYEYENALIKKQEKELEIKHILTLKNIRDSRVDDDNYTLAGLKLGSVGFISSNDSDTSASFYALRGALCVAGGFAGCKKGGALFMTPGGSGATLHYIQRFLKKLKFTDEDYENMDKNIRIVPECDFYKNTTILNFKNEILDNLLNENKDFNKKWEDKPRLIVLNDINDFKRRCDPCMFVFGSHHDDDIIKQRIEVLSEIAKQENVSVLCVCDQSFAEKYGDLPEIKYNMMLYRRGGKGSVNKYYAKCDGLFPCHYINTLYNEFGKME